MKTLFNPDRPLQLPLRAYHDGEGQPPPLSNVIWVSLAESQPWAITLLETATRDGSRQLQEEYNASSKAGGLDCLVWVEFGRGGKLCKDVFTVLKVAALYDAVVQQPTSVHVLWLDFDTWFQRPLDSLFWGWLALYDFATIYRKRYWPDTGITYCKPNADIRLLLEDARQAYTGMLSRREPRPSGFNDVQVFGFLQKQPQHRSIRAGTFATGCRSEGGGATPRWVIEARPYKSKPRQHYCPNETASTSPFNVLKYITHLKGGHHLSGPIHLAPVLRTPTARSARKASRRGLVRQPWV